jgi:all-trans-retinol 13,14-reductase
MFAGFPCAKDSEWEKNYHGVSNAVILTAVKYEWFEKWENNKHKKRGDEYMRFKDIFKNRLIKEICKYYPQLENKIMYADVGSPLTFNHYIGSTFGECYGLNSTPRRFVSDDWLRPKTDIDGLYLSGQDITTLGFTGALMAGVLTAHEIMGYGTPLDIIKGRNLINDLMYMESVK